MESRSVASKTPHRQQGSTSDVDVGSYKSELIVSLTCDSSAASVNNRDEIKTNSAASNADESVGANINGSVIENNSDVVNGNKIGADGDLAKDIANDGNLIDDKAINISANDCHGVNINNTVGATNDSVTNFVSDTSAKVDDKNILNKQENNNNLLKECIGNEIVINSVEFCDNTDDNTLSRCVTFGELTDTSASQKHFNDKNCLIYGCADKNVFDEKCIDNVQHDSSVNSTDNESDEKVTFRVRVVENSPPANTKPLKSILKSPKEELSVTQEKSETVGDPKVDDIESISEIKRAKPSVPPRVSSLPYSESKSIDEKSDKSEHDTSVKNVQDRLAESKSKIDQLQKSLPTRLSSATVESLKIKYSPASFGYPKTFFKSTEDNQLEATRQKLPSSKIPVQTNLKDNTSVKNEGAVETVKVKDFENSERKSSQTVEDTKNILFGNKKKTEKKDSLEHQSSVEENKPIEVKLINSFVYPDSEQKNNSEISKEPLERSVVIETSDINQDQINEKIKTEKTKESNNSAANGYIKPTEIDNKPTSIGVIINNENVVKKLAESDTSKSNIGDNLKENNLDTSVHETNVNLEENIVPGNTDLINSTKEIEEQTIIEEENRDAYADLIKRFTMADKKDVKKRSNSFRRIFPSGLFGSSKDKHKHSIDSKKTKTDKNGIKKSQHNSFSTENAHNEIEYFDRQKAERHTVGHYPYYYDQRSDRDNYVTGHGASTESYYSNSNYTSPGFVNKPTTNYGYQQGGGNLNLRKITRDGMYSETPNDTFVTSTPISENFPAEDYVCMDNMTAGTSKNVNIHSKNKYVNINNYFDASTSSSTSTLTSDTPCYTYDRQQGRRDVSRISSSKSHNNENNENALRRYYAESKLSERNATKSPEQFTQTLCVGESNHDPELIKPKAIIPINTERPLANPYHNVKDNLSHSDAEQLYGNLAYADDEGEDDYEMDQKTIPNRGTENKMCVLPENVLQLQPSVDTSEKLTSFQSANKSPYETIYNVSVNKSSVESGIKSDNVENSNSTSYGSLIPVSAHVKISNTPIISPKKSVDKLRARSLSPEQRYKLDVPKTNQTVLPDSPTKKLSAPLKNKLTNKTLNKHEDIKRNDFVEEESRKISNLPKNQRKSPKTEKKLNKNIKSPEQQRKMRKNSPTHQNLEIELDYPDNNLNENRIQKESPQKDVYVDKKSDVYTSTPNSSRQENYKENDGFTRATNFQSPKEASTFDNVQASKIPMKENYEEMVTNHPTISSNLSENYSRNIKAPLTVQTQPLSSTLQIQPPLSPQKRQILQHVEAFYWSQKQRDAIQNSPNRSSVSSRSPSRSSIDSPSIHTLTPSVVHHNNSPTQYFSNQRLNSPQNVPINRNTNSPIINQRSSLSKIPQPSSNSPTKQSIPVSPQKIQNLQKVEAFYWQKIREMKEKEEEEIMKQHQTLFQQQNYPAIRAPQSPVEIDSSRRIRSRSVSPGFSRHDKRSLSLPRGVNYYHPQGNNPSNLSESPYGYAPITKQAHNYQSTHLSRQDRIPSNRANQNTVTQNQNFVRNSLQRNTIGPINSQRNSNPRNIITDVIYENYIPGVQLRNQAQAVPRSDQTSAGYAPIFKRGSLVSNTPSLNQDSGLQSLKKVSFSGGIDNRNPHVWPTKDGYTKSPPTRVNRLNSGGSDNVFTPSPSSAVNELKFNDFPQPIQNYQNNQLSPESVYGKTTPKQVTVTNKVCDIYGKIHDQDVAKSKMYGQIQKTGVIYGELKKKPNNDPQNPNIQAPNKPSPRSPTTVIGLDGKPVTGAVPRIVIGKDGKPVTVVSRGLSEMNISQTDSSRLARSAGSVFGLPQAPNKPLPPVPPGMGGNRHVSRSAAFHYGTNKPMMMLKVPPISESESGSEVGEVQQILQQGVVPGRSNAVKGVMQIEEEWSADGKSGRGPLGSESGGGGNVEGGELRGSRGRSTRRDDPRRHTLSGDQHLYPGGGPGHQGGVLARTMDLEASLPRGYPPPSSAMLFDDDPGIMSEVETSSTGFRRGGKQRSSLPVVRTPSKTLERPLGLVFLQYRNETKRALLPNEITSIDTVKALFVRSFPKQLTMEYLDSPLVKIYIHDSSKDMFYELEDVRSHLRDIRDRSVLRLFESADVSGGLPGAGTGIAAGIGHFEDQSYFSEPEFDSDYQHQHIHKSKTSGKVPYYMGSASTIPRGGGPLLRTYSPAVGAPVPADRIKSMPGQTGISGAPPKPMRTYSSSGAGPQPPPGARGVPPRPPDRYAPFLSPAELRHRPDTSLYSLPDRMHTDGYMSSPERGSRGQYEDPYYSQFNPRSGSITPVIDEEASDTELLDESYSLYGVKLPPSGPRAVPAPRSQFPAPAAVPYDATRIRVEHMERQLANLTGLVQKALTQAPPTTRDYLQVPAGRENFRTGDEFDKNSSSSSASLPDETYLRSDTKAPKLGKGSCHKSVSFEKSVSFSDEPPDMNSPKQHSPQHAADTKPPKPAIKSSTLPRTSSQERDRLKPAPPPKPAALTAVPYETTRHIYRDLQLTPEMYNQLRGLQKKAKDLRAEVRNLRRMSQAQAHSVRETIRDTFIKIRAMLLVGGEQAWQAGVDQEKVRLTREEDLYKQEMLRLEKDLTDLESTVEELRGNVINRKTRVNMSDVENMALVLSKSSKTVADLKVRFPNLQEGMKSMLSSEMEKVVREEKFLKEEPERLESALRRCKKLTGTLVTLKRLASVQEQRLPCSNNTPDGRMSPSVDETPPVTPTSAQHGKSSAVPSARPVVGPGGIGGDSGNSEPGQRPENALDALLDELQTFSRPSRPPTMADLGRKSSMDSHTLTVSTGPTGGLRRLHSYPSGSDTDNSPPIQPAPRAVPGTKPPLPERNPELMQALAGRRVPPPPPPRTSSRSPLASPTSPGAASLQHIQNVQNMTQAETQQQTRQQSQFEAARENLGLGTLRRNVPGRASLKERSQTLPRNIGSNLQVHAHNMTETELQSMMLSASNSSSCESVNSQEGAKKGSRQEQLELRHQELLKKQKALQEQYARLQQLQRGNNALTVIPPTPDLLLKKTGSESNLLQKMGLNMSTPQFTGSLTHLANTTAIANTTNSNPIPVSGSNGQTAANTTGASTTSKVYETDIL